MALNIKPLEDRVVVEAMAADEKTATKKEYDDGIPKKIAAGTGMCMPAGKTAYTGEEKITMTYKCV